MKMPRIFTTGLLLLALILPISVVEASDLSVRPFLIDKNVEPRQIATEEVLLTNNTNRMIYVYATVNEITIDTEGEIKDFVSPIMSDRTNTPTSWVEIGRGRITMQPGESELVDLSFRIHPNAEPGEYHMFIGFGIASKRYQAEAAAMQGNVEGVVVKLTIEDERTEYLKISGFIVDRFVTRDEDRQVQVELENLGDITASPQGEIIFFNSNGEELNAISFNDEQVSIPPGEKVTITGEIPFSDKLGRFKANLSLRYGENQTATLYDSTQFFMMPLHIIILMLIVAILLSLLIFFLLQRALAVREVEEDGFELPFMVRDGHDAIPQDHDIDLSNKD